MRLNLSAEWYEREFRKDAEEPAVSVTAGRADALIPPDEEPVAQKDAKRTHKTAARAAPTQPESTP